MEKNIVIYNEMRAAAERVFCEGINAPAGVYSFAELAKVGTTCKTAPAGVYFREDYNADELININVDGFECNYPARLVFVIGYKFERLAKVGAKARAAFQRAADHGDPAAVVRALAQSLTLAAIYVAQRTAAALKAARRATIAARAWLRASHDFYAQDGDPIRCTGWQFVGYNIAAAVVAVLLSIKY